MYNRLLIPTDGSAGSEAAVLRGLDLAQRFDADVHVLSVVDARPFDEIREANAVEFEQTAQERGHATIESVVEHAGDSGDSLSTAIRTGLPHTEILDYTEEADIDCIVMGTHGRRGEETSMIGSTTDRVLRHASVPVFTIQLGEAADASELTYRDILVPTDGSDAAVRSAEAAITFAEQFDATVHALYVVDMSVIEFEDAPRSILGLLREAGENATLEIEALATESGVDATTHLEEGAPFRHILQHADRQEADLIALGRRGRTGLPEVLLGSTTARIVRRAEIPVLSVT